jgi:hypothetical protein
MVVPQKAGIQPCASFQAIELSHPCVFGTCRTSDPQAASVAETVQGFITIMDSLKLNLVAVDQVRGMEWRGKLVVP